MDIYKDIEQRTKGEIYIGVVGPVRTGKSTFIKRFMELLVIPSIDDGADKIRANDELPQSASGITIMTTEPKFIPKEAVSITLEGGVSFKVRMIDSVGFMVDGATGHMENGEERMVKTPWNDYPIPFTKAAEIGTKKVIYDHSTIGIMVTCDGTISDIDRTGYIEAEQKTIRELNAIDKPYVIILNSMKPQSRETLELAKKMSEEYGVSVIPMNCDQLKISDINKIFEKILLYFPVAYINFDIPKWVEAMESDNEIKQHLIERAKEIFGSVKYMKDVYNIAQNGDDFIESIKIDEIDLATGKIDIHIKLFESYYYNMISLLLGVKVCNEYDFIKNIKEMANVKSHCEKVSEALDKAINTGYGSVSPDNRDIVLSVPELIKSGNKYGVKIKAQAPSIHLIKANITTEIAPIVGTEEQARDLINYIINDEKGNDSIWSVSIFGKTIKQLVEDGLKTKINKINQESQQKLQDTMEKIVNDSNGGMVCIII